MENVLLTWRINEALQNSYPMHYAANLGDLEVVKALVGRGFFVNCMNFDLVTPLHEAATKGHVHMCEYLLHEGAWVDATNIDGATPLCDACAAGHTDCAMLLLKHKANVNPPMLLTTPLHEAVIRGHVKCVSLLINNGAKLEANDCHFGTPLLSACAAYKINLECVTLLIQAGADVNATMFHKSPLHIATRRKSHLLVQLLLNYGADVYARDNMGMRPSDLIQSGTVIKDMLLNYERHPRFLSDCCRLTILKVMIGKKFENIRHLGLPQKLEQYTLGY